MAIKIKYWAFLSYSSEDRRAAAKIHRRLENFVIPKGIRGTELRPLDKLEKSEFSRETSRQQRLHSNHLSNRRRSCINAIQTTPAFSLIYHRLNSGRAIAIHSRRNFQKRKLFTSSI